VRGAVGAAGAASAAAAVRGGSGAADGCGAGRGGVIGVVAGTCGAVKGVVAGSAPRANGGATGCEALAGGRVPGTDVAALTVAGAASDRGMVGGDADELGGVGRAGCGRNTAGGIAAVLPAGLGGDEGARSRMMLDRPTKPSARAKLP
jgi:hypothetical protein